MKCVLEFGVRGGAHNDNIIVATTGLGMSLASSIVMMLENDHHADGAHPWQWRLTTHKPRLSWQSETHFVALSKLDGIARRPASAGLWHKSDAPIMIKGPF